MSRSAHRFLLALLLLILPLQGLTAVVGSLMCLGPAEHVHLQSSGDVDVHEPSHPHDIASNHDHDDGASGNLSGHLCGHQAVAGVPLSDALSPSHDLPVFQSSISLLATLFIPELPQRPPRS